jgi:hypothetical protein
MTIPGGGEPGGVGTASSLSGSPVTYATGGKGASSTAGPNPRTAETANTGNGGNGIDSGLGFGNAGQSGIVIIRYVAPVVSSVTFTSTQSYTIPAGVTSVDYLVVAGGGGGSGGGGGAGGFLSGTAYAVTAGSSSTITVGSGGALGNLSASVGTAGTDSTFYTITANGGGGGGGTYANTQGGNGGSGGGGSLGSGYIGTAYGGSATAGQGNNGGSAISVSNPGWTSGGGGGAGGAGDSATNRNVGDVSPFGALGGLGLSSAITGQSVMYSVGGQGYWSNTVSGNATANSGNGGGGCRARNLVSDGWNGGSGVVILKLNYS